MEGLLYILFIVGVLYLVIRVIKVLIKNASHVPTWEGIIISAVLGMLPLYLILCFFGIMGEVRNKVPNNTQMNTGNYAENMSRRYSYDNSTKKKRNWVKYAVLVFVIIGLFYVLSNRPERQEVTIPVEVPATDNAVLEEKKEEVPPVVKKKLSIEKEEKKNGVLAGKKQKSTLELLEEENHAEVVKQAKEVGVSTEGSTIDILERINHAEVVKQAKEAEVSTEGSTIDILERINHAEVVKQAKEAGVSTEGSTIDILERISRKNMEKYYKQ